MSHLFAQAERSCELLGGVDAARDQLRQLVTASTAAAGSDPSGPLKIVERLSNRSHALTVTLAVLGDWHQRSLTNLPLLTKLNLISTVGAAHRLGFQPEVTLVPLQSRQST